MFLDYVSQQRVPLCIKTYIEIIVLLIDKLLSFKTVEEKGMTDYRQNKKPASSRLMKGFGAVTVEVVAEDL
jgi:hypothetical protein